ncbi:MAG: hypothetical protein U0Q22_19220 [Acidimicrobiales bacterium]
MSIRIKLIGALVVAVALALSAISWIGDRALGSGFARVERDIAQQISRRITDGVEPSSARWPS